MFPHFTTIADGIMDDGSLLLSKTVELQPIFELKIES